MKHALAAVGALVFMGLLYLIFGGETRRFGANSDHPLGQLQKAESYLKERKLTPVPLSPKALKRMKLGAGERIVQYMDTNRGDYFQMVIDGSGKIKAVHGGFYSKTTRDPTMAIIAMPDVVDKYWRELTGKDVKFTGFRKYRQVAGRAHLINEKLNLYWEWYEESNRVYFNSIKFTLK